jgi:hypothetical protein
MGWDGMGWMGVFAGVRMVIWLYWRHSHTRNVPTSSHPTFTPYVPYGPVPTKKLATLT